MDKSLCFFMNLDDAHRDLSKEVLHDDKGNTITDWGETRMTLHLKNVHFGLPSPGSLDKVGLVKGDYEYWHYCCDGVNDRGWGCGYRTLQTLCSWVRLQHQQQQHCYAVSSAQDKDTQTDSVTFPKLDIKKSNVCDRDKISVIGSGSHHYGKDGINVIKSGTETDGLGHHGVKSVHDEGDPVTCVARSGFGDENDIITVIASGRETDSIERANANVPQSGVNESGLSIISGTAKDQGSNSAATCSENRAHQTHIPLQTVSDVPSLMEIQKALVSMGDKPSHFVGSRQWIGSYEVCLCLDFFFNVPCKIIHINQGTDIQHHLSTLHTHFSTLGSPVMMGGDTDASSKGIMGVCMDPPALLVVDPHCSKSRMTASSLQAAGWVKWVSLEDFHQTSFYNVCLPQFSCSDVLLKK